jgi:branched-chain amino acid transport system permease protein
MTFFDGRRSETHAHEGGLAMIVPLVVLAAGAVGLGYFGHQIVHLLGGEAHAMDVPVAAMSSAVAIGGVVLGFLIFEPRGLARIWERFKAFYRLWPFSY